MEIPEFHIENRVEKRFLLSFPDVTVGEEKGVDYINVFGDYLLTDALRYCYSALNFLITLIKSSEPIPEDWGIHYSTHQVVMYSRDFLPYLEEEHEYLLFEKKICFYTLSYTLEKIKKEILAFLNSYLAEENKFFNYVFRKELADNDNIESVEATIIFEDIVFRSLQILEYTIPFSRTPESDQKQFQGLRKLVFKKEIQEDNITLKTFWRGTEETYKKVIAVLIKLGFVKERGGVLHWQKNLMLLITLGVILREKRFILKEDTSGAIDYDKDEIFLRMLHNTFPHPEYSYKPGNRTLINRVNVKHKEKFGELLEIPAIP